MRGNIFQILLGQSVRRKRLAEAYAFQSKRHKKKVEAEKRQARKEASTFAKKASRTLAKAVSPPRLSTDPAWKIQVAVVRHHPDPFLAMAVLAKLLGMDP